MTDLVVGGTVDVELEIRDKDGNFTDPASLEAWVTAPNQAETHYTFPDGQHLVHVDDPEAAGYNYLLTWLGDDDGRWFWRTLSTDVSGNDVGSGDGYADVRALHSQTGGPIPDIADAELEIVIGDDYQLVDGRAFEWSARLWPTIDGATITVKLRRHKTDRPVTSFAGAVVNPTKVRLELDASQTRRLTAGRYSYAVQALLSDDNTATIAVGTATVVAAP